MKLGDEDDEPLPPLPQFLSNDSSEDDSLPSLTDLSSADQTQRRIDEQQKQIDMLLKAMDSRLSEKSEKNIMELTEGTSETLPSSKETSVSSVSVAPLRAMIFVDGTWLYYTIHERREGKCPIIAKYGRGWQEYYKINWNELPRIISEVVQNQESNNGWFNADGVRPVEISRVNVFTSAKKNTSTKSDRLKMFEDMRSANYDVYMMETVGQSEKCIDIQLAVEMLHYATVPNAYDVAILLSGDKDFLPALIRTRQKARKVGIVSMKPSCNRALYETPNSIDYDVIWLEDYLDRLFIPLQKKTRVSAGVSRFTLMKVIYDFIDKSGLPMVSSRDIGSYLKTFHVGESDFQSEVKYNYRGLHLFIREANLFSITSGRKADPRDKSFWIGLEKNAEDVLLAEARKTKLNQIEKDFFNSYTTLGLLDNREEVYGRSLTNGKSERLSYDNSNKEKMLARANLSHDQSNQGINNLALQEKVPPTKHDYSIYKVTQLKSICRERGLAVSGVKAALRNRLEMDDESDVDTTSRITLEKTGSESAPKDQIDDPTTNYLLDVVKEYIQASGGTASSRELGRYLAANSSFSAKERGGIGESALVELKNTYGSLVKFLDAFPGIFDRSEVDRTEEGDWEFQASAHK